MSLGENIYRYRTQKNMSQGDLADTLEVSRQSVSKWENNSAVPELDKLVKMSQVFGVTLDELVNGEKADMECNEPTPQPIVIEARHSIATQKIIGIILLCFGLLFFLMMFWSAGFSALISCVLLSAPFILCGVICLKVKIHVGLLCLYTMYLFLWLPMGVFTPNYLRNDIANILQIIHMLWGFALIYWGWRLQKRNFLSKSRRNILLFFSVLVVTILLSYLFMRFPGLLPTPGLMHS